MTRKQPPPKKSISIEIPNNLSNKFALLSPLQQYKNSLATRKQGSIKCQGLLKDEKNQKEILKQQLKIRSEQSDSVNNDDQNIEQLKMQNV